MTIQKNAYIVMDTETSGFSKLVFDFGWTTIDKRGNVLGKADMVFFDVAVTERPYFINKVKGYARRMDKGIHRVTSFAVGRRLLNMHIAHLKAAGYRVILCAYNAGCWLCYFIFGSESYDGLGLPGHIRDLSFCLHTDEACDLRECVFGSHTGGTSCDRRLGCRLRHCARLRSLDAFLDYVFLASSSCDGHCMDLPKGLYPCWVSDVAQIR